MRVSGFPSTSLLHESDFPTFLLDEKIYAKAGPRMTTKGLKCRTGHRKSLGRF